MAPPLRATRRYYTRPPLLACYDGGAVDLLDESKEPSTAQELRMRRSRKVIILVGACALALLLTVRHRGADLSVETNTALSAAVRQPAAAYDLSQLPVITKALFFVRENYFDKSRFDHKRMLVGALDFLQRDVPE